MQNRLIAEADALTPDNSYDVYTLAASHAGHPLKPVEVTSILDQLSVCQQPSPGPSRSYQATSTREPLTPTHAARAPSVRTPSELHPK